MPNRTFTKEDFADLYSHDNDPVKIFVIMKSICVHRVLVDQGSSTDVLFWDAFVAMCGSVHDLETYEGALVGFSSEPTHVQGYLVARTTFGEESEAKTIDIRYMV